MIVNPTDTPEKMSCNGCRVLRKGCSESCILRPCLQWIESPESQAHATVFVAKFFGRAGLMSFISAVPETQRPGLFQSLLYEACGRTVNPVYGAVGLLSTGNWHVCQAAVEAVLRGGKPRPLPEAITAEYLSPESDAQYSDIEEKRRNSYEQQAWCSKSSMGFDDDVARSQTCDLDLGLALGYGAGPLPEKLRPATPSLNSEGSVTTSFDTAGDSFLGGRKVLNLLV